APRRGMFGLDRDETSVDRERAGRARDLRQATLATPCNDRRGQRTTRTFAAHSRVGRGNARDTDPVADGDDVECRGGRGCRRLVRITWIGATGTSRATGAA